jgi:two-component system chemotaxis response regulator CheB
VARQAGLEAVRLPGPVRVLIAEDDATFAIVLQHLIEGDPAFEVVGRARNGEEAFTMALSLRPDIVTMDVVMPVRDGIEATRMIRLLVPDTKVVIVSASPHRHATALAAGAVADVPKQDVAVHLLEVLRAVAGL